MGALPYERTDAAERAARRALTLQRERGVGLEAASHYVAGELRLDREHTEKLRRLARRLQDPGNPLSLDSLGE